VYVATAVGTYFYLKKDNQVSVSTNVDVRDVNQQPDRSCVFNSIAWRYDSDVDWPETWTFIKFLRSRLLKQAQGDVLEVGIGTGRNLQYYRTSQCRSITGVDISSKMLHEAVHKIDSLAQKEPKLKALTTLTEMDSQHLKFADQSFDTVVDTFGLCSLPNPQQALREMQRVCKPGGNVLLLEHGLSSYKWLNDKLHSNAQPHAHKWGCWWNRDIEALVKASGLEVTSSKRYHFGTTYVILAKPGKHL